MAGRPRVRDRARGRALAGAGSADPVARGVGLRREAIWALLLDELDRRDGEVVAATAAR